MLMKWLFPTLALFCFLSCGRRCDDDASEITPGVTYYTGTASAQLNGAAWPGFTKYIYSYAERYHVQLDGQMPDGSVQFVSITGVKPMVGRYEISDLPGADGAGASFAVNGDAVYDIYHLLVESGHDNFIEITSIDGASDMVEGNFEVAFVIDSLWLAEVGQSQSGNADTVRFSGGAFKAKLSQ